MGSRSGSAESVADQTLPERFASRQEWKLFGAMYRAAPGLAVTWAALLVLRGLIPAVLAVVTGWLIGSIDRGESLVAPLVVVGVTFVLMQVLTPVHQAVGSNLGSRTADDLNRRLLDVTNSPPGMAHLERPDLINDLTMARDFDLGITGPPLSIAMDFIASGLVELVAGIAAACVLFGFAWWAPFPLLVGWGATHWLLKESAIWKDRNTDEVRNAQRHAEYAYRLAVDAPASKEVRLFGLASWVIERFRDRRTQLHDLQWHATRLRERSVLSSLVVVLAANAVVFWALADGAADGDLDLGSVVIYLQAAIGASAIAFGGLSWALDGAAAPVAAVARLEAAMPGVGALPSGSAKIAAGPVGLTFDDVTFTYPTGTESVLRALSLDIPAGSSLAIVGQNGAGKTTLAKLICRLYEPTSGRVLANGTDLADLDLAAWRGRVAAVFQDFVRYELPLADNVDPSVLIDSDDGAGSADRRAAIEAALTTAGADELADLDTVLAKGYDNGTDLSGGQWQRVALARALYAVRTGAGVVLLDEPTAQLDVRGESEIFERILAATRDCTTILVSHRFSTVRHADRICVVEDGRVIELGSHDELMELGGRYQTMFELQASRFAAGEVELDEHGKEVAHDTL